MVGTLTVQNLQGPASGANANKVIIPSGHVLDVSGGTLVPSAGAVVGIAQSRSSAGTSVSTTGTWIAVSGTNVSIATKQAGSSFIYHATMSAEADATSPHNCFFRYKYRINGGSWVYHSSSLTTNATAVLDSQGSFNENLHYVFDGISYTAGNTIEFMVEFQTSVSGVYFNQPNLSGQPSGTSNFHQISVMEIAQ